MELFDAIYQRRAIKAFDPDYTISAEDEQKLFEAAIQAPTSFNIQHWRFVVVRDKALRQEMRKLGNEQAQITDASLLVIMTADMKAWEKSPARYWAGAPKEVADLLVGWMGPFHEGREWLQRDEAQRSSPDLLGFATLNANLQRVLVNRPAVPGCTVTLRIHAQLFWGVPTSLPILVAPAHCAAGSGGCGARVERAGSGHRLLGVGDGLVGFVVYRPQAGL